jgi:hypothetical protein
MQVASKSQQQGFATPDLWEVLVRSILSEFMVDGLRTLASGGLLFLRLLV